MPAAAAEPEPRKDRWTILDVLRWTTTRFEQRALATPRLDAELLIGAALGVPRIQLYVQFERPLLPEELAAIRDFVRRRQAGEPVAYIVGKKEFFGLELAVDARVLIPRPDTETLVDEALARLAEGDPPPPETTDQAAADEASSATSASVDASGAEPEATLTEPDTAPPAPSAADAPRAAASPVATRAVRIADVATGSGAIAITLFKQRANATVFATDVSPGALEVARANAERLGVEIAFVEGDLGAPLAPHGPFDLIVANLPYVASGDLAGLAPEVRSEPVLALDGGADGLDLVRRLVAAAPALLVPGGALALEIGAGQGGATQALLQQAGFVDVRARRDLGSIDRVISGRRP